MLCAGARSEQKAQSSTKQHVVQHISACKVSRTSFKKLQIAYATLLRQTVARAAVAPKELFHLRRIEQVKAFH